MRLAAICLYIVFSFITCSGQKKSDIWMIKDVTTNYVQKGILDENKIPSGIIDKKIQFMNDNLIVLTKELRKKIEQTNLFEQFGDTIHFDKKIYILRQDDDELSTLYPGDELTECIINASDTCYASNHFFNLLGVKVNSVVAHLSTKGKYSKIRCLLFVLKQNREMILYSENDFLLFRLYR